MATTKQIRNKIKALTQQDQTALDKFIAKLPTMVEERRELRTMLGSAIIKELTQKGQFEEAAKHDPNKTYKRLYTTLVEMNHRENAHKAFARNGVKGLQAYQKKVIEHGFKMKGKYPHLFPNNNDGTAKVTKTTFWNRIKNLFKRK